MDLDQLSENLGINLHTANEEEYLMMRQIIGLLSDYDHHGTGRSMVNAGIAKNDATVLMEQLQRQYARRMFSSVLGLESLENSKQPETVTIEKYHHPLVYVLSALLVSIIAGFLVLILQEEFQINFLDLFRSLFTH